MNLAHLNFDPPLPRQHLPAPHLLRKHTDGSFEIIVCQRDRTIRFFGATEDTVYKQAMNHLARRA
jgi:hypothetical protein